MNASLNHFFKVLYYKTLGPNEIINETDKLFCKYIFLKSRFETVKTRNKNKEDSIYYSEIEKLLKREKNWINAYRIEQFMVYLLNEDELNAEIKRYQLKNIELNMEIKRYQLKHNANSDIVRFHIPDEKIENADEATKRELLKTMTHNFQLAYTQIRNRFILTASMERRASLAIFFCLLLFFLPHIIPEFAAFLNMENMDTRAYFVGTALFAGMLGASFSILTRLENKIAESSIQSLKSMTNWATIIARLFMGGTGGLLMFYLIDSKMIAGSMFPDLIQGDNKNYIDIEYSKKSLLIVWCILAGFSEKLISTVLRQKGDQVGKKAK